MRDRADESGGAPVGLGEALRREAAEVVVGPPPFDRVVARGRRTRRLRRAAGGLAAVAVLGAGVLTLGPGSALRGDAEPEPHVAGPAPAGSPTVLEPGTATGIGHGLGLGLWPDGSHLVAPLDEFTAADGARSPAATEPLTSAVTTTGTGRVGTGTWRGEPAVTRVTVDVDGREREATLVALPGDPGWGGYHVDLGEPVARQLTVTAYAANGEVLSQLTEAFAP